LRAVKTSAAAEDPIIFVVDDDASMRAALDSLLRSVGLQVKTFDSAADFVKCTRPDAPSCLVLDVRMPGIGGLDFQADLARPISKFPSSSSPVMATYR
jgi:FixJ family two-component response regulator